jgi:hypothetical protein
MRVNRADRWNARHTLDKSSRRSASAHALAAASCVPGVFRGGFHAINTYCKKLPESGRKSRHGVIGSV